MSRETVEPVVETDSPSRRKFLSYASGALVTVTGIGLVGPLVGMFLAPLLQRRKERWLGLGKVDEVTREKPQQFVFRYVRMDGWYEKTVYGTAYAVRQGSDVIVLSNICTHLGCGVRWDSSKHGFACPCHNGLFDEEGKVVSGPPPKPLKRFDTRIVRGEIQIRIEEA